MSIRQTLSDCEQFVRYVAEFQTKDELDSSTDTRAFCTMEFDRAILEARRIVGHLETDRGAVVTAGQKTFKPLVKQTDEELKTGEFAS